MKSSLKYASFHLLTLLFSTSIMSGVHTSFETTRMKSTGSTGVGSILLEEANFLNPAPLGIYDTSSVYLQRIGNESQRSAANSEDVSTNEISTYGAIVSDTKARVGGSLSYFKTTDNRETVQNIAASFGYPVGKSSAFGTSYRWVKSEDSGIKTRDTKQVVFGLTHLINSSFSMGLVAIDPFGEVKDETRAILGAQYVFKEFISVMFDAGSDYTDELSEKSIIRGAIQFRMLNNFYLRAGAYNDKGEQEKGSGVGIGWVQPKLMLEAALKNSQSRLNSSDKDQETSFSLSYRF